MLLLLPPSETKVSGGVPGNTGYPALSFPSLDAIRHTIAVELTELSRRDPAAAAHMLKLGPKSAAEVEHNLSLDSGVLLPAIERYTGVLYAETGAAQWSVESRGWSQQHLAIQSSLWGVIRAQDPIPSYRLSSSSRLAGRSMRAWWGTAATDALATSGAQWILDARSGGYRELGPVPDSIPSAYLEVVTRDGGVALNHFNKKHKGELVRALAESRPDIANVDEFVNWATAQGFAVTARDGVVTLAV